MLNRIALAKNALFLGLVSAALAALIGTIWLGEPRPDAGQFRPARYQHDDFRAVVEKANAQFRAHWEEAGVEPAPRAPALKIARRLSLGLTGTIPSLEEIRELEKQPEDQRVAWWTSHLLADRRYADYVAERFARAYVGVENGPFLVYRRRRFVTWLSDRLQENMRYDQIARDLIEAEGLWTSHPEVNFLTVTIDQNENNGPDEVKLAARVTRAFLGVRIDCVQCHDDNLGGDWEQTDFHELASFFSDAQMTLTGVREKPTPYEYQYLHADDEVTVPARVPFYDDLLPENGEPRARLAAWATHPENRAFARATVNRVWALMFGRPLVEPVDNIPLGSLDVPGLDVLAKDFVEHGYNLQRLIHVIAATDVFQRDSRADFQVTPQHERAWAVFPLTRLRPEQVAGSILQAASLKTIDADSHILRKLQRYEQENEFVKRYGDTGEDEFDDRGGTIPQRLLMMNGALVQERTKDDFFNNASTRIAALAPDNATAVETAYLVALSRRPTDAERKHFVRRIGDAQAGERNRRLEDLFWTLLNSTEFSWGH